MLVESLHENRRFFISLYFCFVAIYYLVGGRVNVFFLHWLSLILWWINKSLCVWLHNCFYLCKFIAHIFVVILSEILLVKWCAVTLRHLVMKCFYFQTFSASLLQHWHRMKTIVFVGYILVQLYRIFGILRYRKA